MPGSLAGKRIGITAGPIRAWIDPVRYLANASTGVLGCLIADDLAHKGAEIHLLLGRCEATPKHGAVQIHPIETVDDLLGAMDELSHEEPFAAWVHAMAVLDFVPTHRIAGKIESGQSEWNLALVPAPKVIDRIKRLFPGTILIGFKLESTQDEGELREAADHLAGRACADLVVANPPPFDHPSGHTGYLWDPGARVWSGPFQGKEEISLRTVDWLTRRLLNPEQGPCPS